MLIYAYLLLHNVFYYLQYSSMWKRIGEDSQLIACMIRLQATLEIWRNDDNNNDISEYRLGSIFGYEFKGKFWSGVYSLIVLLKAYSVTA